jgi:hypothetical protein
MMVGHDIRRIRVVVAAVLAMGVLVTGAQGADGCASLAPGSIMESDKFTPAAAMRSVLPPVRMGELGVAIASPADDIAPRDAILDGMDLRVVVGDESSVQRYYHSNSIPADMTLDEFMAAGGIQLHRDPAGGEDFAAFLLEQLGDRAVPIQVGESQGTLTWADPTPAGVRSHNLYWSDGRYAYPLIAVREPEHLASMARALACGG